MGRKFIINGQLLLPDRVLDRGSLVIDQGYISHIYPGILSDFTEKDEVLDVKGAYLLPGIIDIHTDALDAEIIPRPGADIPIEVAFSELERKMAGVGFTTVFHSLHIGYSSAEALSRSRYSRQEVFETLSMAFKKPGLLRNKIHLRYEISGIDAYSTCIDFMEKKYVSMLSIMDHTPGQGQFGKINYIEMLKKTGKSEKEALEKFEQDSHRPRIEPDKLSELIKLASLKGIPVASHDDDSPEKIERMHTLGVSICEFPITLETAHHAQNLGMMVVGGASNILRGGSLSGNADMKTAVLEGAVNVLCSDYYPPSILHSIFKLFWEEAYPLHLSTNLATKNAAIAAKMDGFTGTLVAGKAADILVVNLKNELPFVSKTMVDGQWIMSTSPRLSPI